MKKLWAWGALFLGILYFVLPLVGMTEFSLKMRRGEYSFDAYAKAKYGIFRVDAEGRHLLSGLADGEGVRIDPK